MMGIRRRTAYSVLPLLLVAAACSENPSAPSPREELQITADVATYVADQTVDDVLLMTVQADAVLGGSRASSPPWEGTLTVSREVTFYDSTDVEQSAYDRDLTAKMHLLFSMEGSRTRSGARGTLTVEVDRERDMWVTGLLHAETQRTWNGTGNADVSRARHSDAKGDRTYDMTSSSVVTDVVVPVPRTEGAWPLSGTITRVVHVEVVSGIGDTKTRDRTVVIEFNGTQFVPITINGETFTLDLATREIVKSEG